MNILYLSYDGMTDPLGQSQVLPYLAGIAKAGHRITLVSFEKPHRYQTTRSVIESFCNTHNINWQPLQYTKRPPVLSTMWDVRNMQRKAEALHRKHKFDLVHCRSYISALVGERMKRKHNVKFVFDMRGFWADERVEGKLWDVGNILYRTIYNYFKRKETQFLNAADYIISLTKNAAEEIHTWPQLIHQPVPIEVIPCCADVTLFDPAIVKEDDRTALRNELKIAPDDFVLSYVGSLGTWYMLDEMLDFFSMLYQRNPNAKFLVITNDPETDLFSKTTERNIPANAVVVTQAPRKLMPLYISISDATLFFIRPTFSKKASSPVKQGEAMAMGIPIVCNAGVGDTDTIVGDNGIVIGSFDSTAYADAITRMLNTRFDSSAIRRYAIDHLSLESGIEKYLDVYKRVAP